MLDMFRRFFPVLEDRNLRLFFIGQGLSFVGTWIQVTALAWLVMSMTHSVYEVGMNAALSFLPTVFLTPVGGAFVDRFQTRNLLGSTTVLGWLQAMLLALLFMSGHLSLVGINLLTFAWGVINGLDSPVRYGSIARMVGDPRLIGSAMAFNGFLINVGFILGPAVAGILIAIVNVGATFMANMLSFLPMLFLLGSLEFGAQPKPERHIPFKPFADTVIGIRYVLSHPIIGFLLLILGITMVFGASFRVTLPMISKEIFQFGPEGYGWLAAAPGMGAFFGAIIVSRYSEKLPIVPLILCSTTALGGSLVLFSLPQDFPFAMMLLGFAGLGLEMMVMTVQAATARLSPRYMVGRVVGCGASVFFGGMALGNFLMGILADQIGAFSGLALNGAVMFALAIAIVIRIRKYDLTLEK